MEIGALILALLQIVLVVLEERRATRPQREAIADRKDGMHDLGALNQALRTKDADGVATFFEQERLEAWGRITPDADDRHGDGLRASGGDHSGQPPASHER